MKLLSVISGISFKERKVCSDRCYLRKEQNTLSQIAIFCILCGFVTLQLDFFSIQVKVLLETALFLTLIISIYNLFKNHKILKNKKPYK